VCLTALVLSVGVSCAQQQYQPQQPQPQQQQQQQQTMALCSLCQDGTQPQLFSNTNTNTNTNTMMEGNARSISWEGEEWDCADLAQILMIIELPADSHDCSSLQLQAFIHCGCPTFSTDTTTTCSLCPGGFLDLPEPDRPIPGHPGLTCIDIVFSIKESKTNNNNNNNNDVNEEGEGIAAGTGTDTDTFLTCDEIQRFSRFCGCPYEPCSLCRYKGEVPQFPDRIIPFLSTKEKPVTCADYALQISRLSPADGCKTYQESLVPVDVPAFCGCPLTRPTNACTLCSKNSHNNNYNNNNAISGGTVRNKNLVIPQAGQQTCEQLEQYLSFITDRQSCLDVTAVAEACCQDYIPCPICPDGTNGLGESKIYQPYLLSCDNIGLATHFGFPLSCEQAKERFPAFCGCPGVTPACTICPWGMAAPDPSRFIPLLGMTCGQVNDFLTLRNTDQCADAIASFSINVAGFCGCIPTEASLDRDDGCAFCPEGQVVSSESQMPNEVSVSSGTHGTNSLPCRELSELAPYVVKPDLCRTVQLSIPECCGPPASETPRPTLGAITAPQPTPQNTETPGSTLQPTQVQIQTQSPQTFVPGGTSIPNISSTIFPQQSVQPLFPNTSATVFPATTNPAIPPAALATMTPIIPTTLIPNATATPETVNTTTAPETAAPTEESSAIESCWHGVWTLRIVTTLLALCVLL